jgi:hypothetical protein
MSPRERKPMSRTPENENLSREANQDYRGQQKVAFGGAQRGINQFGQNLKVLDKGGQVGADPFLSPGYLANQNRMTAYSLEGENDSAKQALEDQNRRTGGQNTGATQATIADLARVKMRLGNQLNAQRSAGDYRSNLDWQKYLAGAPLESAAAQSGLYGIATGGRSATGHDLTEYGKAQQQEWYKILDQMINSGKAAAGAALGGASPASAASTGLSA